MQQIEKTSQKQLKSISKLQNKLSKTKTSMKRIDGNLTVSKFGMSNDY